MNWLKAMVAGNKAFPKLRSELSIIYTTNTEIFSNILFITANESVVFSRSVDAYFQGRTQGGDWG